MKILCVALLVAAGSLLAAESSRELTFQHAAAGLPRLQLSHASPPAIPSYGGMGSSAPALGRAIYFRAFPTAPTDLIAPPITREMIIQDFQRFSGDNSIPAGVRRKSPIIYPVSGTDLIGPSSDREKLIEAFKSRTRSDK